MGVIAESQRNAALNAIVGRATFNANAGVWVKLHTGDPGDSGTDNPATETTRQQVTFGSDAADGEVSNTALLTWTNITASGTETISHISLWDDETSGTYLGKDDVPGGGKPVTTGDTLTIGIGAIKLLLKDPS